MDIQLKRNFSYHVSVRHWLHGLEQCFTLPKNLLDDILLAKNIKNSDIDLDRPLQDKTQKMMSYFDKNKAKLVDVSKWIPYVQLRHGEVAYQEMPHHLKTEFAKLERLPIEKEKVEQIKLACDNALNNLKTTYSPSSFIELSTAHRNEKFAKEILLFLSGGSPLGLFRILQIPILLKEMLVNIKNNINESRILEIIESPEANQRLIYGTMVSRLSEVVGDEVNEVAKLLKTQSDKHLWFDEEGKEEFESKYKKLINSYLRKNIKRLFKLIPNITSLVDEDILKDIVDTIKNG